MKFIFFFIATITCLKVSSQLINSDREVMFYIEQFRNETVAFGMDTTILFVDENGKKSKRRIFYTVGTGVMFYVKTKTGVIPCVVTAKHVLYDPGMKWIPQKLSIRFNQNDTIPIDKFFGIEIPLYDSGRKFGWFVHPDSTVDLAAILLNPNDQWPINWSNIIRYSSFPEDNEYYEGKEVFVLGYPGAVGQDFLSKAVVRKGIIAWVPVDINKSNSKILIDCNIFPGNSGGPVFSIPHNTDVLRAASDTFLQKPRFYGIVSQRRFSQNNLLTEQGKTVLDSNGTPIRSLESIGIGVIINAKKVRELLNTVQNQVNIWMENPSNK